MEDNETAQDLLEPTEEPRTRAMEGGECSPARVALVAESWQNHSVSPTVLQSGPYRLFFFSSDRGEPDRGFATTELNKVEVLVRQHEAELVRAWHDYFKSRD